MSVRIVCLLLLLFSSPSLAAAQLRVKPRAATNQQKPEVRTIVSVELLLAGRLAGGLTAQQWGQTFEKLGYRVRIRQSILDEKPEISERTLGRTRQVKVTGLLDRRGTLIFPEHTFSRGEETKLKEWLRSLQVYGAQGSPKGQPIWGLNKAQFDLLYNSLSETVTDEVKGKRLKQALAALKLPDDYPARYTTAAREVLSRGAAGTRPVRLTLKGHSKGTALALMLHEYGLGFRPLRTPDGSIELAIESTEKVSKLWPLGWKPKGRRAETAPQLFERVPVELDEVKLADALAGIAAVTGVPIHIDRAGIRAGGIDVDQIVISYPAKKTSWSLLLGSLTTPHKLTRKFRIDEKGRAFVWVTALVPGPPPE